MSSLPYFRLSELSGLVAGVMDQVFSGRGFWVIADVTSHSFKAGKNHHYFDLIEKDPASSAIIAKFQARAWTEGAEQIANFEQTTGQRFTNDINVLLLVSVYYHPAYGLQLVVHDIDTSFTLGTLEKQKQATLLRLVKDNAEHVRLEDDGYVTYNQELKLPKVLQHIAVISSSTSAGYEDFLHTLENNSFNYAFRVDPYFTVVQGENNAQYIVDKLIEIYHSAKPYDAVVIIRGGGAQTDLLLFEQYAIGRAIARFPIPVITGIGHQKNETVADLMAHTSVKTPTKAAELIIARNRKFFDDLLSMEKSITIHAQQVLARQMQVITAINSTIVHSGNHFLNRQRQSLSQTHQQLASHSRAAIFQHQTALQNTSGRLLRKPSLLLYQKQSNLNLAIEKLRLQSQHYIKAQQANLDNFVTLTRLLSPKSILKKGFAIVMQDNQTTSSYTEITTGQKIEIILDSKTLSATIDTIQNHDGKDIDI